MRQLLAFDLALHRLAWAPLLEDDLRPMSSPVQKLGPS